MADGANIEIRAAQEDELPDMMRLCGYSFGNNSEEPEPLLVRPEQTLCAFDGERMVATSGAFDFQMRMNGRAMAMDGVTLVTCDPGYRRRGLVRQLMEGLLQRAKERDVPLAALWASMGAIYQRFGYGLATTQVKYEVPLRFIQFQFGEEPTGSVRRLGRDEALPHLESVYQAYSMPGNGMLHRSKLFWDLMLKRSGGQHTWIAVYFDARGEPRGYCLYKTIFDEALFPESPQIMDVFDFVWLDMDAYRGLWRYLGSHDLVDRIRFDYVAEDDPAPSLFLEPRRLRRKTGDGVWMRVVDVADALTGRGYDQPGEAVIEITDDALCPWNNGCYRLSVNAGGEEAAADVERLNGPASPDLAIRPEGFASLVSGHSRASDLARMGRAAIPDEKQAASLDAFFATRRRPHCPNMF
ncbi:MAG: GNAT family N-acetyltransferase [Gammaproteobacteria bacterium]|nr:MAG: GNAT family N-acetyltransferase [Gammaproteobacteria bacterium]